MTHNNITFFIFICINIIEQHTQVAQRNTATQFFMLTSLSIAQVTSQPYKCWSDVIKLFEIDWWVLQTWWNAISPQNYPDPVVARSWGSIWWTHWPGSLSASSSSGSQSASGAQLLPFSFLFRFFFFFGAPTLTCYMSAGKAQKSRNQGRLERTDWVHLWWLLHWVVLWLFCL